MITVTWNSAAHIAAQLRSVTEAAPGLSLERIVVDNGSTDGTPALVAEQFPEVSLLTQTKNLGFGRANNLGLAQAHGEFILFANPDMRFAPGTVSAAVAWLKTRPDVGLVGGKLEHEDGSPNTDAFPRKFPTAYNLIVTILKLPHLFPGLLKHYQMHKFNPNLEQDVDSVRGSCMLFRKSFLDRLGFGFDPRYFIWFEDVDVCREVRRAGLRVMHLPMLRAVDYVGQSFKKRQTSWKQFQFTRSAMQYVWKWEPWYKALAVTLVAAPICGLAWIGTKLGK